MVKGTRIAAIMVAPILLLFGIQRAAGNAQVYPRADKPIFTRENAPLCPSHRALGHLMQRAYAHDLNATLFDFGCLPAADGWPVTILAEQQGMDRWALVQAVLPHGFRSTYWTLAWELRNGAASAQILPSAYKIVKHRKPRRKPHRQHKKHTRH